MEVSEAKRLKTPEDENTRAEAVAGRRHRQCGLVGPSEGGLPLQPGQDGIRARGSRAGALNYIVTSMAYEFAILF